MADALRQVVEHFFHTKTACHPQKVLLALSGGPDSLALFYLLLDYCRRWPQRLSLAVAHVDHCWRPVSGAEAAVLCQLADSCGLPYHSCALAPEQMSGNKEALCRQLRLEFFHDICHQYGYAAVILGHHADDQAETVIKRLCEGSHLDELAAMTAVSRYGELKLWRPLLCCRKKQLVEWLTHRNIIAFDDVTNRDERFLRSRLRGELLPTLSHSFGKQIHIPLCRLAKEAEQLDNYLTETLAPYLQGAQKGPWGTALDLTEISLQPFLEYHLIRRFCLCCHLPLSRSALSGAAELLGRGGVGKSFFSGSGSLVIDRRRLFVLHSRPFLPDYPLPLEEGRWSYGSWAVGVASAAEGVARPFPCWRDVWCGHFTVRVCCPPQAVLRGAVEGMRGIDRRLDKCWSSAKVPSFMRYWVPIAAATDGWQQEFLSGSSLFTSSGGSSSSCHHLDITFAAGCKEGVGHK